jgi:hypothetical protein
MLCPCLISSDLELEVANVSFGMQVSFVCAACLPMCGSVSSPEAPTVEHHWREFSLSCCAACSVHTVTAAVCSMTTDDLE